MSRTSGLIVPMGTFGGKLWDRAVRDGRIRPGRGPLFTRRVYPSRTPVLRQEALQRAPRRTVDRAERAARGVILPPPADHEGPDRLGPLGWHSGDTGIYRHDIVTRLRIHWLCAPDCVGGGWRALASHGVPYWADSEKVLLLSRTSRRNSTDPYGPVYRTLPPGTPTVCVDPEFPGLRVVDAATAVAQCLATIRGGKKTWWVPEVPVLGHREVRSVQLLDAVHQCTELTDGELLAGARHIVDKDWMTGLLELSDHGAQSPMETVLRLIARDELPAEYTWTSQVTVSLSDGAVVTAEYRGRRTTPDLACPELRVALYYDGAHHGGAGQTETDFRLYQELRKLGWETVRVNKGLLADRAELTAHVRGAVERARWAQRMRWDPFTDPFTGR